MRVIRFCLYRLLHHLRKPLKHLAIKSLVFVVVFFGVIMSLNAEIYKWQDDSGLIYYSNHPPTDLSRLLEIIPGQNPVSEADAENTVYYFAVPGQKASDGFTVSPEVLQDLFSEASQSAAEPLTETPADSPDLTALTMRLDEVERALKREIATRSQWERQYAQARLVIEALEHQNQTLTTALTGMEADIDQLQGTVIASDMEVSALKQHAQPGQYAMLETTVVGLQDHLETLALKLDSLDHATLPQQVAALAADVDTLKRRQQPDFATQTRLASVEREVQSLTETLHASSQVTKDVLGLQQHDRVISILTNYHDDRLNDHQVQIAALQNEFDLLKASRVPSTEQLTPLDDESRTLITQLLERNQFMETVIDRQTDMVRTQHAEIKAIQAQLRQLQGRPTESTSESGIRIIPRMERRRTSLAGRFLNWLTTPQALESEEE